MKTEILHARADEAPHQRAGTVATDHIAGCNLHQLSRAQILVTNARAGLILLDCKNVAAGANRNMRPASQAGIENLLEVRLMEAIAQVPAQRRELAGPRPVEQELSPGVQKAHSRTEDQVRQQGIGKADGLEHAHGFVVEMHRPRQVIAACLALQHQGANAGQAEQIGKRRADGPAPDNHDVIG